MTEESSSLVPASVGIDGHFTGEEKVDDGKISNTPDFIAITRSDQQPLLNIDQSSILIPRSSDARRGQSESGSSSEADEVGRFEESTKTQQVVPALIRSRFATPRFLDFENYKKKLQSSLVCIIPTAVVV